MQQPPREPPRSHDRSREESREPSRESSRTPSHESSRAPSRDEPRATTIRAERRPARWTRDWSAEQLGRLDADLRTVLTLIEGGRWSELARRTGIVVHDRTKEPAAPPQSVPLVVELTPPAAESRWSSESVRRDFAKLGFRVAAPVHAELGRRGSRLRRVPTSITVDPYDPTVVFDAPEAGVEAPPDKDLGARLRTLLDADGVERIALSAQHLPCLEACDPEIAPAAAIGVPADRRYQSSTGPSRKLTGKGVVVGIVDDGCPFAHHDFLVNAGTRRNPVYRTRVARLWDQSRPPAQPGWVGGPGYGREIDAAHIDAAIAARVSPKTGRIDERAVYDDLGYRPGEAGELASHGGRVVGIAAGNGRSLFGCEGVAPEAEIVFVQLPAVLLASNPAALEQHVIDAMAYVFQYASAEGRDAVVNLSLGGYTGAHDGTMHVEQAIDELVAVDLQTMRMRAVVVSAGNGFEADCHTVVSLSPVGSAQGASARRTWILLPGDPTENQLEVWYAGTGSIELTLTTPDGAVTYGPHPVPAVGEPLVDPASGAPIGTVDHVVAANGDRRILLTLFSTAPCTPNAQRPVPAGRWTLTIANAGGSAVEVHAWIRRDDVGALGGRREQSRFDPDEATGACTIGDTASGTSSIAVGAFNVATGELGRYSAAGPTRAGTAGAPRPKPEICAPAEAVPRGGGVLATASSRGQPARIGGTSAAAPHVTGLVALAFQYARAAGRTIDAATLRTAIAHGNATALRANRHQQAARYPAVKQSQVWNDVIGGGAVDFTATMRALFP